MCCVKGNGEFLHSAVSNSQDYLKCFTLCEYVVCVCGVYGVVCVYVCLHANMRACACRVSLRNFVQSVYDFLSQRQ